MEEAGPCESGHSGQSSVSRGSHPRAERIIGLTMGYTTEQTRPRARAPGPAPEVWRRWHEDLLQRPHER